LYNPRHLRAMHIDLNADVGESFGPYSIGHDAALLPLVTSVNVAAGFHGGDPTVLRDTIRAAKANGVAIGAHPGLPDLVGFGRREMTVTPRQAEDLVLYQIAAVAGVARSEGLALRHVKPHGALYNMASRDRPLADAIVRAIAAFDRQLVLMALPNCALFDAGRDAGLLVAGEGFADRAYEPNGALASRAKEGAVLHDSAAIVSRAVRMVTDGVVEAIDGSSIAMRIDTICVHSDTPGADRIAAALRAGLHAAGITVEAFRRR